MYDYPKAVNYATLDVLRDSVVRGFACPHARMTAEAAVNDFIREFKDAMNESQTVFYQP